MNYTDEQYEQLEQEEREVTDEAILAMIVLLMSFKDSLEDELRQFYSKYGKDGVVTYSEARKWSSKDDHRRRLTVLLLWINENFSGLLSDLSPKFKEFLEEVISKESNFFGVDVDSEEILKEPWGADEATWLDRLDDDIAFWCAYILSDIKRAFIKGDTLDEILTQVTKRFKYMAHIMETLGLSESTAVGSIVRREIFRQLGITKYQFFTKPDERRCETCGAMHGLVFPMSAYEVGVTASPLHPRCRCWEVPIVD